MPECLVNVCLIYWRNPQIPFRAEFADQAGLSIAVVERFRHIAFPCIGVAVAGIVLSVFLCFDASLGKGPVRQVFAACSSAVSLLCVVAAYFAYCKGKRTTIDPARQTIETRGPFESHAIHWSKLFPYVLVCDAEFTNFLTWSGGSVVLVLSETDIVFLAVDEPSKIQQYVAGLPGWLQLRTIMDRKCRLLLREQFALAPAKSDPLPIPVVVPWKAGVASLSCLNTPSAGGRVAAVEAQHSEVVRHKDDLHIVFTFEHPTAENLARVRTLLEQLTFLDPADSECAEFISSLDPALPFFQCDLDGAFDVLREFMERDARTWREDIEDLGCEHRFVVMNDWPGYLSLLGRLSKPEKPGTISYGCHVVRYDNQRFAARGCD